MNKFKEIFKQFKKFNKDDLNIDDYDSLIKATENGNLDFIKELFLNKKIKSTDNFNTETIFNKACINGHIDIVQYFLNSEHTKKIFNEIHIKTNSWIKETCENGHLDVVKYLFSSKDLNSHPSIHVNDDEAFVASCNGLNFELIKFLSSSEDLKENSNIHAQNDKSFISVCNDYYRANSFTRSAYMKYAFMRSIHGNKVKNLGNPTLIMEIIKYFIFDLNIEKNENIKYYLNSFEKTNSAEEFKNTLNKMFEHRDFHNSLVSELEVNETKHTHKRMKL